MRGSPGPLILGIGGFDHDGALSLVRGPAQPGEFAQVLGHQEWERTCRRRFAGLRQVPELDALLDATGWPLGEVARVAWADRERFEHPDWLGHRERLAQRFLGRPLCVIDHHECHLRSAYAPSGWSRAAVLSVDGKGDGAAGAIAVGDGDELRVVARQPSASSVGRLWHALAICCGYPHFGAAGKVMALAAYGRPRHLEALLSFTVLCPDGTFRFTAPGEPIGEGPTFRRAELQAGFFGRHLGVTSPPAGELPGPAHADLAASVQAFTNHVVAHMARAALRAADSGRLCLAGGVALNVLTNRHLLRAGVVEELFVQPAAGDSGLALGAALACAGGRIDPAGPRFSPYLGRTCGEDEVLQALASWPTLRAARVEDVAGRAATRLAEGALIGWVQGRAEAGPRALGARSLLASPLLPGQRERLNRVKAREPYRPVALAALRPFAVEAFSGAGCEYMLRAAEVRPAFAALLREGLHVDGSCRLEVVDEERAPQLAALLRAFGALTGVPALINTSLNAKGEPLAERAEDALALLAARRLDGLYIGALELREASA